MSLIKNSVYNLAGFAVPTLIAIPCLGLLARMIGTEKFGIFTLAFAIVGYASIFDAGITRAVIREISINRGDYKEQKNIISTATLIVFALGLFATILLFLFAPQISSILKISEINLQDAICSFRLLSIIIPLYLINQIWLAYLEGQERFGNINIQRCITSSSLALLPLLFVLYSESLVSAIAGLCLGRIISLMISFLSCKALISDLSWRINSITLKRLIRFGGWLTISNIISPIMVYFDRFVVSNLLGANKIAFYTAPSEGVARLVNIPAALSRALFPKLSYATSKKEKNLLEIKSYIIITVICLPIVLIGIYFSSFIMTLWMGSPFSGIAATVLKILLVGFYFNALAQIPFALIQADGNSKITALIHCAEIIPYLILLYVLTENYGIVGTALAWSIRTTVDFILLVIFSRVYDSN